MAQNAEVSYNLYLKNINSLKKIQNKGLYL